MRDCCPANQFDHACEDGICKSYNAQAEQAYNAKRRSYPWFEGAIVAFYLVVAVVSALTLENHFKREALINQENVHVVRR
jgi:hypothetical protein